MRRNISFLLLTVIQLKEHNKLNDIDYGTHHICIIFSLNQGWVDLNCDFNHALNHLIF